MEYTIKTINELCTKITDGSHFSPENEESGKFPMYSVKDMEYNNFSNNDCKMIGQEMFEKLSKSDCRPLKNDILIAKDGSYLKYAFKVNKDLDACILSSIAILRPNLKNINPDYFVYLMRTKSIKGAMANYVSGSALPRIILSDFKKMKLKMISSLPIQQKIASILSAYDNLIQNYKKQIEDLQTTASDLYKEWFVRFRFPGYKTTQFENGIPVGWKVEKIKNYVNRLPFGQTYKKDELEEEGKVIVIDQSEDELLGYHNNEPSHKASSENPIALFGDHSCKYKLMIKDFSLGENIIPYTAKNVDLYYLYYAVYKIVQTEEYKRHWTLFINKKILIPENGLQVKFKKNIIPIYEKIEIIEQQITNLTQQRDLLLPRLMSGKLEVE